MGGGRDQSGKMYFENIEGRWILSEINTPAFRKKLTRTRTDVRIVKSEVPKPTVLAVRLTE